MILVATDVAARGLDVDDVKFTVTLSMFFRVRWEEPRIIGNKEKPRIILYSNLD